ncbi:MAG: hypothetical protein ACRECO_20925 [Xanthobacteraceae bacterium]
MMTIETKKATGGSLARGWLQFARRYLGNRWMLMALGGVLLAAGTYVNWRWLVAAGVMPIVLALAPCAIMCALGLCCIKMMGGGPK